jgi:hypothetical protein
MVAIPFDTLKFARHLEASGLAASAAAGAAEALADALTGSDLATRADLTAAISGVKGEILGVKGELLGVKAEIAAVKTELKNDIELSRRDITIKFGSMLVIAVGVLLAAIRYLPPHS